ncbi:MAG: epoxyqueuosine reductase [Promethearchaeota archaeon]
MSFKSEVINEALRLGFADIGFTTAEPFETQKEILSFRLEEYAWAINAKIDLLTGIDPKNILPDAKSIIVLIDTYFDKAFPPSMVGIFGRCYQDDDRVTHGDLYNRIKAFRSFLRENGINSQVPFNIPHRLSAVRAGLGTFGKNNFFYSRKVARKSSWVSPIPIVVDFEFVPDEPTLEVGCPSWCKHTCIVSCPTGALNGIRKIDPRKCISYLSYFGEGITPMELREPMGMWVYGCDRCQEVCPRNKPWMAQELPINKNAQAKEKDFQLDRLLHMDKNYYKKKIWPHMFYMSRDDLWRWKMNVARAMGNSLDPKYVPELIKAFKENNDERVNSMIAWALGRIGGAKAKEALESFLKTSSDLVREEILYALEQF